MSGEYTPTSYNISSFEECITMMMREDGWRDVPQDGDPMKLALGKVINYIDWLRKKADLLQADE